MRPTEYGGLSCDFRNEDGSVGHKWFLDWHALSGHRSVFSVFDPLHVLESLSVGARYVVQSTCQKGKLGHICKEAGIGEHVEVLLLVLSMRCRHAGVWIVQSVLCPAPH